MWQGIKDWYNQPYTDNMNVMRWFLFFGMVIVLMAIWKVIIWHLQDAA